MINFFLLCVFVVTVVIIRQIRLERRRVQVAIANNELDVLKDIVQMYRFGAPEAEIALKDLGYQVIRHAPKGRYIPEGKYRCIAFDRKSRCYADCVNHSRCSQDKIWVEEKPAWVEVTL